MSIEYILILVPDLGLAGDYFTKRLGFKLEPVEKGSLGGTFCRHILLANAIIELIVIDTPNLASQDLIEFATKYKAGLYFNRGISPEAAAQYNFPPPLTPHPNGVLSLRELLRVRPNFWWDLIQKAKRDLLNSGLSKYFKSDPPAPPWLKPFADFQIESLDESQYRNLYRRPDTKPGKLTAAIEERGAHAFALVLNVQDLAQSREWLARQRVLPPPGEQNNADYIWLNNQRGYGTTFFLVPEKI